jgi:hypothetical protein
MARFFADGATQYMTTTSATGSAVGYPLSYACWFNTDDISVDQVMYHDAQGAGGSRGFSLWMVGTSSQVVRAQVFNAFASSTTGASANTWHHAAGVFHSATLRNAYIDGGSKGTNTTNRAADAPDRQFIGAASNATTTWSGAICEIGVWTVGLSDAEVALLAKGASPLMVQPDSLLIYVPLIRTEDRDWLQGITYTPTNGPTVADHVPAISYPRSLQYPRFAAGVPPPVGQPMMLRGTTVPRLRQWQPRI